MDEKSNMASEELMSTAFDKKVETVKFRNQDIQIMQRYENSKVVYGMDKRGNGKYYIECGKTLINYMPHLDDRDGDYDLSGNARNE